MNQLAYGHMVQEYYVQRLKEIRDKRMAERSRIRTRKQALQLAESVRKKIFKCFGPFPKRTPLNAKCTGILKRKGYTVEKILFESRSGFPVSANLYIPDGKGPFPGVIGTCGHSADGKSGVLYQAYSQGLVKKGYVVLTYDPISQGERLQFLPEGKFEAVDFGCCHEHNLIGNAQSLFGDFFGMWRTWDGIRALDYLWTRPELDKTRIGVTGNSGGGTLTSYLNALDPRFTMAAPGCFVTTMLRNIEGELASDAEQIPPGFLKQGLDEADFFIARAPRPVILLSQINDFFDHRGTMDTLEEVKRIYGLLGKPQNAEIFIGPRAHGYYQENREAMYRFFNRHAGVRVGSKEPSIRLEKNATLACAPKGQVHYLKPRRAFDFNRPNANEVAAKRKPLKEAHLKKAILRSLRIALPQAAPSYRVIGHQYDEKRLVTKGRMALQIEPGIQTILYVAAKRTDCFYHLPAGKKATLYLGHMAFGEDLSKGLIPLPGKTVPIFAFEPRGLGALQSATCPYRDTLAPFGNDYLYASHGELLDEPYLGKRVYDLLCAFKLMEQKGYTNITLEARGMGAIIAALAAPFANNAKAVRLTNTLLSYHELTQTPIYQWPFSSMVPRVLKQFDLPDVYRLLGRKGLQIINPWDARMKKWNAKAGRAHAKTLGIDAKCIRFR